MDPFISLYIDDQILANTFLTLGSKEELESKMKKYAPHSNGDFVRIVAKELERKKMDPKSVALHVILKLKEYSLDPNTSDLKHITAVAIPQMLFAFSEDSAMQNYLLHCYSFKETPY